MNAVGKNLKRLRQREKLTQDALAEQLHVTRQAVSSWETGKTQPDVETLTALAEVLHTDIRELIYGPEQVRTYRRSQRKYVIWIAACVAVLFICCVLEAVLKPFVQQIGWETPFALGMVHFDCASGCCNGGWGPFDVRYGFDCRPAPAVHKTSDSGPDTWNYCYWVLSNICNLLFWEQTRVFSKYPWIR